MTKYEIHLPLSGDDELIKQEVHDIAHEIEFIAAVRQGLSELDRGERIPIEEVERELPSWIIK